MIDTIHFVKINECCKTGISAIEMILMFIGIVRVLKFHPLNW